jgi:hypothetical protein
MEKRKEGELFVEEKGPAYIAYFDYLQSQDKFLPSLLSLRGSIVPFQLPYCSRHCVA